MSVVMPLRMKSGNETFVWRRSARGSLRGCAWALFLFCAMTLAPLLFMPQTAWAEFKVPQLTGPVVDEAHIIDAQTSQKIEAALRHLRQQGGSQITVLTVPSLEGLPIEQASIRVTDQWKLGGEKTDNGVLLLVAPKERKVRIEVGQGLEGVLTDADSKRIIAESITPLFRAGDYSSGVLVGVYQISRKTDPGIDLQPYLEGAAQDRMPVGQSSPLKAGIILLFLILFFIFSAFGGGGGGRRRGIHRGGYYYGGGGWGGGGGGFGGRGGGGSWSGGGGGFSGGGASGDW